MYSQSIIMSGGSGKRNAGPPSYLSDFLVQSVCVKSVTSVGPRPAAAAAAAVVVNNHSINGDNIRVNNSYDQ